MEKRESGLLLFLIVGILFVFLSSSFVSAQTSSSDSANAAEKAYNCLKSEIANRTSSDLTLEQAFFSAMALGSEKKAIDKISAEKSASEECWPKLDCTLRDTSLAALALSRAGQNTDKIEQWLLLKNMTATDLVWYLEIDIKDRSKATCTISYKNDEGTVDIKEDQTLTRNTLGECFSISNNLFWLKITPSCLDYEFSISCDKDFVSAVIYQKKSSDTIYVSSESHTSVAKGTTKEQVKAKCFKSPSGNYCDYEGSLWATFVASKLGNDVSSFIPYLIGSADDNTKYFPSAFLYMLTSSASSSEYYTDILQKQNRQGIWDITASKYKKYYDTSLALLALGSASSQTELEKAKNALVSLQKSNGCWLERDSIIDTAFILYSGWQRAGGTGGGGTAVKDACTSVTGQACEKNQDCLDAGGKVLKDYTCNAGLSCCSKSVPKKKCVDMGGKQCGAEQTCDGDSQDSADGTCCLGECVSKEEPTDECTPTNGICKVSCTSDEIATSLSCGDSINKCCKKSTTPVASKGISWVWIVILIILIILVILAIIYRDKLKIWWYKWRGKASSSPVIRPGGPSLPERPLPPEMGFRPSSKFAPTNTQQPVIRPQFTAAARRPISPRDQEMEETLKKLKEMSK